MLAVASVCSRSKIMMAVRVIVIQATLMACWLPSSVLAFTGVHQRRMSTSTININLRDKIIQSRSRQHYPILSLGAISGDDDESEEDEDGDPLLNDQREGMADAFAGLDSLTADDFDDLRPLSSIAAANSDSTTGSDSNMEESAKIFMEMQAELSTLGEEGVYDDILGDLSGDVVDVPKSYLKSEEEEEVTSLIQALDEAAEASDGYVASDVLDDADGLGSTYLDSLSTNNPDTTTLTTADVSKDILTQDIKPSMSMDEFVQSAIQEAVSEAIDIEDSSKTSSSSPPSGDASGRTEDIAKTAEQLLENEELRREIESIFDKAGEKLRLEVEAMKKEQAAVTQKASTQGLEYIESEKQRISEAEESVTRLIQKVARETEQVQKAMEDLELAKNEASGNGGSGSIEDTAIDLKKGGIVKQAALVGGLLFGSRAFTETILVVGSPYGDEHFVPAIVQAAIAVVCAAYFFLVK